MLMRPAVSSIINRQTRNVFAGKVGKAVYALAFASTVGSFIPLIAILRGKKYR
jgi:hypothetical protein